MERRSLSVRTSRVSPSLACSREAASSFTMSDALARSGTPSSGIPSRCGGGDGAWLVAEGQRESDCKHQHMAEATSGPRMAEGQNVAEKESTPAGAPPPRAVPRRSLPLTQLQRSWAASHGKTAFAEEWRCGVREIEDGSGSARVTPSVCVTRCVCTLTSTFALSLSIAAFNASFTAGGNSTTVGW